MGPLSRTGAALTWREIVVAVLAAMGLGFSLSGAVGILRMPDVYTRIQCSSKTVTMGALPLLVALVIAEGPVSDYGGIAIAVAVLLFVFSPVASHSLGRAAYRRGVPMWEGSVTDQPRRRPVPDTSDAPDPGDGGTA